MIRNAVTGNQFKDKLILIKNLEKVNRSIKNGYKAHLDNDLSDLKSIIEGGIPKEGTEYKMMLRDPENINLGTNPALLNDLPKNVMTSVLTDDQKLTTIKLQTHLR